MIALRILDHLGWLSRGVLPSPCPGLVLCRERCLRWSRTRASGRTVFPFFTVQRGAVRLEAETEKSAAAILACGRPNGTLGLTPLFLQ